MYCRFVAISLSFVLLILVSLTVQSQIAPPQKVFAYSSTSTVGSATSQIRGVVRDTDGNPVRNANVQARELQRNLSIVVSTDSRGTFSLNNIPPGTYEVTASAGVSEAREEIDVDRQNGAAILDLHLQNRSSAPEAANGSTISAAEYAIPEKAREIYLKAADAYDHGKLDVAREKVDSALAHYGRFAQALTLRALIESDQGQTQPAIADLLQSIQYDPNVAVSYMILGSIYNSNGRFNNARAVLALAEQKAPSAWQTYFEQARAELGCKHYVQALQDLDHASRLEGGPSNEQPEFHLVRGYAYLGITEIPSAVTEFETFLARQSTGNAAERTRHLLEELRANTITTAAVVP